MSARIPVIDLFAGPGGLSEGFSRHGERDWLKVAETCLSGRRRAHGTRFDIALSIEKDSFAHATLELRALVRNLPAPMQRRLYRPFLLGEISRDTLFERAGEAGALARAEAWNATLGELEEGDVDARIASALKGRTKWVLIGGPPCQAYSLAGRSRNRGIRGYRPEKDNRHFLYEEYLRIVARHQPPVFVMENVKGLLSSRVAGESMFERIVADLRDPGQAVDGNTGARYGIHAVVAPSDSKVAPLLWGAEDSPSHLVVRMEHFGIPQRRHRVILLGVRADVRRTPLQLLGRDPIPASRVLDGLPHLRSAVSRGDSPAAWLSVLSESRTADWLKEVDSGTRAAIRAALERVRTVDKGLGGECLEADAQPGYGASWYNAKGLVLNHSARGHIPGDLQRYFFAAAYASTHDRSPTLSNFPSGLLPKHRNALKAIEDGGLFGDRFRVQVASKPSTTITSHISKDGHYYIHYDAEQCRSLTVREAARLQTFPDDYLFCGPRTEQYRQVGNAVPPLFAAQAAAVVADLLG